MIPKIIHYCWFGKKPMPKIFLQYMKSWEKFFPGYEIKEWNEDNFDLNVSDYVAKAYELKKYAFVSDYVRYYVLYKYGGLYFDTDVEVIKPMDDIIAKGAFMGVEKKIVVNGQLLPGVNPGLGLGAPPNHPFFKKMLDVYNMQNFVIGEGSRHGFKTIVDYTTEAMCSYGYRDFAIVDEIQECCDIFIYPKEYFCPDFYDGKWIVLKNTRTIHHYAASWLPLNYRIKVSIVRHISPNLYERYQKIKKAILGVFK